MAGGDTMPVKNRLKEIRHELYIDTQKEFAELVGVTRQQINLWENQKTQPAIETLVKLWLRLQQKIPEINLQDLLDYKDLE